MPETLSTFISQLINLQRIGTNCGIIRQLLQSKKLYGSSKKEERIKKNKFSIKPQLMMANKEDVQVKSTD